MKERSATQARLLDPCAAPDEPAPARAGPEAGTSCFEKVADVFGAPEKLPGRLTRRFAALKDGGEFGLELTLSTGWSRTFLAPSPA